MLASKLATFGGGCFWCTEACIQKVNGVVKVVSGYAGGKDTAPTYKKICNGQSDHAEVIQVTFDPSKLTYLSLLKAFFKAHDPTTLNYQGNDHGTQYRSIILYHDEEQKATAKALIEELNKNIFSGKIVTLLQPYDHFYPAEDYHQDYFNLNPTQGYCAGVIKPKLSKFLQSYKPGE